jgi:hypothetical protein
MVLWCAHDPVFQISNVHLLWSAPNGTNVHLYTSIETLTCYLKHSTFEYCHIFLTVLFIYLFIYRCNPHVVMCVLLTRARVQFKHECVLHLPDTAMRRSYSSSFYPSCYVCQDMVIQEQISVFLSSRMKTQDIQSHNRDVPTSNGHSLCWWRDLWAFSSFFRDFFGSLE